MKKFIALSLIVGSFVFFIVTIAPRTSHNGKNTLSLQTNAGSNSNLSFNLTEKLNINVPSNGIVSPPTPDDNLTEYVASLYSHAILKENGIQSPKNNLDALPDFNQSSADALVKSVLSNGLPSKSYSVRDVLSDNNQSDAAVLAYFETLSRVTEKSFSRVKTNLVSMLSALVERNNPAPLQSYATAIKPHISELLATNVPPQWKLFHVELLNLWEKKFTVVSAILNSNADPLRGYLALEEFDSIQREDTKLQSRINKTP